MTPNDPARRVRAKLREVTDGSDAATLGRAPAGSRSVDDAVLRTLCEEVAAGSISLVTSDIFDTIVFRPTVTPTAVFELIGDALLDRGMLKAGITPAAFARLRAVAERRARQRRHDEFGDPESSLHEIYRELPLVLAADFDLEDAVAL